MVTATVSTAVSTVIDYRIATIAMGAYGDRG